MVVEIGIIFPHQLPGVFQSVLIKPVHVPVTQHGVIVATVELETIPHPALEATTAYVPVAVTEYVADVELGIIIPFLYHCHDGERGTTEVPVKVTETAGHIFDTVGDGLIAGVKIFGV